MPQPNADKEPAAVHSVGRRWLAVTAAAAVIVVAVVLIVVLVDDEGAVSPATADSGAVTEVTSPYDFSELPEDSGPPQVENASYVSILLADEAGQVTAYGLNSNMSAAEALKQAVLGAGKADFDLVTSIMATASTVSGEDATIGSTLTFVFPEREKLTFDLYVEQGLIARGRRAWRVDGDLAALIEAAVAAGQQ